MKDMKIGSFFPGGKTVECETLVADLLGLDPAAVASLSPSKRPRNGAVCTGLNVFMRRTLKAAVEHLWTNDLSYGVSFDEAFAKTCGWPDARTMNLSTLFTWALQLEIRCYRALAYAPLVMTTDPSKGLPQQFDGARDGFEAHSSARVATGLLEVHRSFMIEMPEVRRGQTLSVCGLTQRLLGFSPAILMQTHHPSAELAFKRDPEGQTAAGLAALMKTVLITFNHMRDGDDVQILIAEKGPAGMDPRIANISTLLAAGIMAEGGRRISFELPRLLVDPDAAA